jgi:outer membrane protein TolC
MVNTRLRRRACAAALAALALPGCALLQNRAEHRSQLRAHAAAETRESAPEPGGAPFAGAATLEREALVAEALRRNPSLAAARHAWRAAVALHPQETALDDPMVGYMAGPRSFDSPQIRRAQRIEARQAFPFPGTLALRGDAALAGASAMASEHAAARIALAALASSLYDEYWLATRSLEQTRASLALLRSLHDAALGRYESGGAEADAPLAAELEEAELLHREVEQASARRIAAHQIAQLLHRPDGAEIPPPPDELIPLDAPADADAIERAVAEHPALRAAEARVEAKQAGERLALRAFLPDFALTGGYDTFWELADQRPFVGIEIDVPLQIGRRRGALEQARAELAQARAERDRARDEVESAIRIARERLDEAHHGLAIVRDRLRPAASDRADAMRAGFEAGRAPLGEVLEAERRLRDAELAELVATADSSRRAADLWAALGRAPGIAATTGPADETPEGGSR